MSQDVTEEQLDLRALLAVLLSYWKFILSFFLLCLGIGVFYAMSATPVYKTDSIIQVDKVTQGTSALGSELAQLVQYEASPAATEIELIKSRRILLPVINDFHLDMNLAPANKGLLSKFSLAPKSKILHNQNGVGIPDDNAWVQSFNVPSYYYDKPIMLSSSNGQDFELSLENEFDVKGTINKPTRFITKYGNMDILVKSLPTDRSYLLSKQAPSNAVEGLKGSMSVMEQGKMTGILYATLQGNDQDQITSILTAVVRNYYHQNQDISNAQTSKTLAFMQEQLPKLKKALDESQVAFNKFREQNSTVDIDKEAQEAITERTTIETSLRDLQLKKADLSQRFTDEYPVLQQLNAQIAELESKKAALNAQFVKLPETQRRFTELSSDVKINNEIYLTMLKNYQQLEMVKSGQVGYVRVVDWPMSTYQKVAPRKGLIILISALIGLILGSLLAFLRSMLKANKNDDQHIRTQLGSPVIAEIANSKNISRKYGRKATKLPLLDQVDAEGEAYEGIKALRSYLLFNSQNLKGNKVLITGANDGVGKTFVVANLGVSMAQAGKRVLIIDADARNGHLHQYFNLVNGYGLTDYLADNTQVAEQVPADLIQRTVLENLDFIPHGKVNKNASELLINGKFQQFIKNVEGYYDFILFDAAAIGSSSDAAVIGQLADTTLCVTRSGISSAKVVDTALQKLKNANVNVDGLILNDIRSNKK